MQVSRLPIPDIRDELVCQHSFKQGRDDSIRLRPPKLKHRLYDSNFNRSHSSASASAQAISFQGDGECSNITSEADALLLCPYYDRYANETYFEQCFTRLAKIGEGSFGEVFKVISKEDGLLYAVKMSKQLFRSEHYRQERLEEVRRYEQFSGHSNCVRFYRAWEQDDRLYMQMELCRESLERYLERHQNIPEKKIWCILLDLLLALKSLHDRNLIHLDIKLDNVLIARDDGSCKLADFGLVIDVDRANRHQATEGDSRYIAPEILRGEFSKAADIFSLGIAMLELSCYLQLPSNGPLWQQLRSGILPEDFIKSISVELQTIIKDMMTPNPLLRPTVNQLLSNTIFKGMLQNRSRWDVIKKFQRTFRNARRIVWATFCNLKSIFFTYFTFVLTTVKIYKPKTLKTDDKFPYKPNDKTPTIRTHIISSTPTTSNAAKNSCFEQVTPSNFAPDQIVNSTPLLPNINNFRSRKALSKTSFRMVESGIESAQSLFKRPNNFQDVDDIELQSSFMQTSNSSLRAKRLFSSDSD